MCVQSIVLECCEFWSDAQWHAVKWHVRDTTGVSHQTAMWSSGPHETEPTETQNTAVTRQGPRCTECIKTVHQHPESLQETLDLLLLSHPHTKICSKSMQKLTSGSRLSWKREFRILASNSKSEKGIKLLLSMLNNRLSSGTGEFAFFEWIHPDLNATEIKCQMP